MIEESLARVVSARRAVARGSRGHKRWWLIAKNGNSRVEFLTTDREGDCGETLVIFGYEEEARPSLYTPIHELPRGSLLGNLYLRSCVAPVS